MSWGFCMPIRKLACLFVGNAEVTQSWVSFAIFDVLWSGTKGYTLVLEWICMCVRVCVITHIRTYLYTFTHIYIHLYAYIYIYT